MQWGTHRRPPKEKPQKIKNNYKVIFLFKFSIARINSVSLKWGKGNPGRSRSRNFANEIHLAEKLPNPPSA